MEPGLRGLDGLHVAACQVCAVGTQPGIETAAIHSHQMEASIAPQAKLAQQLLTLGHLE